MRDASTYPITTPYGYVAGYPLNNGFHKGVDRAAPLGTPVIVNDVVIGLVGSTGASTGNHLHIGRFVGGQVTNPGAQGFSLKQPATVFSTGYDATNGNYVKVTDGDGVLWVYLHLQKFLVTKGQKLEGANMDKITKEQEIVCSVMQTGYPPGDNYDYRFTGLPLTQANLDKMLQFWSAQRRVIANDAQIDTTIATGFQAVFGKPANAQVFDAYRGVFRNNYVEANLTMLKQFNDDPDAAWRNPGAYAPVGQLYIKK